MNVSNFFIDALNGNDSAISLGSKKTASPAFLFSDIMKVYEDDNKTPATNTATSTNADSANEIFSAADSIINVNPEEFEALSQLVTSIIKESGDQQPTSTNYDIGEAKISKQQFIISEDKLVELLGNLVNSLGPFLSQLQSNEISKPISLCFKSGADKLTISLNPIKVDENYTNSVINDEFGFVNKLIVKEGLFNTSTEKLSSKEQSVVKENEAAVENQLAAGNEGQIIENANSESPNQIFFRTEILKIINVNPQTDNSTPSMPTINTESTISTYLTYKNFVSESQATPDISAVVADKNTSAGNTEVKVNAALNPVVNSNTTETEQNSNAPVAKATGSSLKLINLSQDDAARKNVSVESLLAGLTDEEKSVFKNFTASGEIKTITYSKEKINNLNKASLASEPNAYSEITKAEEGICKLPTQNSEAQPGLSIDKNSEEELTLANTKIFVKINNNVKIDVKADSANNISKTCLENNVSEKSIGVTESTKETKPFTKIVNENSNEVKLTDSNNTQIEKPIAKENTANTTSDVSIDKNIKTTQTVETISEKNIASTKTDIANDNSKIISDKNTKPISETELTKETKPFTKIVNENANEVKLADSNNIQTEKPIAKENTAAAKNFIISDKNVEASQQESALKEVVKEEKPATVKENIESKENVSESVKDVKHSAQDSKANLTSEDDASKRNAHESFKNTLTQTVSNDLGIEKTKAFSDLKSFHEPPKMIKQSEIIPEFSKLIQQGDKQSMTFQLTPENLGKVKLIIDLVNNQIVTKIEVENEQVKQFIQSNVEQLKQNLQASGIQLNNVNISLADYNQKDAGKMFTQKRKSIIRDQKEIKTEEISDQPLKKMGYNTYEFLA